MILDVARCYLWLFTLYINIKIGKYSCLFVLSFFPRDALDEIVNLIESVSEGFLPILTNKTKRQHYLN